MKTLKEENPAIKGLDSFTRALNSFSKKELDKLAREMKWGTYGYGGKYKAPVYKSLGKLTTPHIKNILMTQFHASPLTKKVLLHILERRNK